MNHTALLLPVIETEDRKQERTVYLRIFRALVQKTSGFIKAFGRYQRSYECQCGGVKKVPGISAQMAEDIYETIHSL